MQTPRFAAPLEFRAWNKKLKVMVTDFAAGDKYGIEILRERSDAKRTGDTYEIMQFTGLKDKNGTKVFGGDVVWSGEYSSRTGKKSVCVVEYSPNSPMLRSADSGVHTIKLVQYEVVPIDDASIPSFDTVKDWVVVGNVFENSELVK